ncbi:hypothetical protein LTR84_007428 [Exophiala bonariae]|uniref:Uncharacterized protein n=1 Tax=Exophiala bonariae TaxID=1690606 RepID=A0AAV9MY88_9EURO|nr:hypothetical protein LTR84_007428 [Exophiala bonariae]
MLFHTIAAAESTTATVVTITAASPASSITTGSYTLCQFYSSVPGATGGASGTSSLLPPCPSSIITYSYTTISVPTTTLLSSTLGQPTSTSYTLCQFYSSLPAITPEATSAGMTTILPGCPSDLVTMTYVLPTLATATVPSTPLASIQSATANAASGSGLVSSFSGLAAPTAAVDKLAVAGIGALFAVVGVF